GFFVHVAALDVFEVGSTVLRQCGNGDARPGAEVHDGASRVPAVVQRRDGRLERIDAWAPRGAQWLGETHRPPHVVDRSDEAWNVVGEVLTQVRSTQPHDRDLVVGCQRLQ